jgi:tetratricopeptide (TPR) repeat protein
MPLGLVTGFFLYPVIEGFRPVSSGEAVKPINGTTLVAVGLLSAIIAHFLEINFGIAVVSTRLYYFSFLGILTVLALGGLSEEQGADREPLPEKPRTPPLEGQKKGRRKTKKEEAVPAQRGRKDLPLLTPSTFCLIFYAFTASVILFTFGYPSAILVSDRGVLEIMGDFLFGMVRPGTTRTTFGIVPMVIATIIAGGCFLALALGRLGEREKAVPALAGSLAKYGLFSVAVLLVTMFVNGMIIKSERDFSLAIIFYMVVLGLYALSFAMVLAMRQGGPGVVVPSRRNLVWIYGLLAVVAVWSVTVVSVTPVRATIYHKMATSTEAKGRFDESVVWYRKAIDLNPNEDYHYLALGRVMLAKANRAQNAAEHRTVLKELAAVLEKAHELNPLNPDHMANLGFVYGNLVGFEPTPEARQADLERADYFFRKAMAATPFKVSVRNNWARVMLARNDVDGAMRIIDESMKMGNRVPDTYLVLGDIYARQGKLDKALEALETAAKWDRRMQRSDQIAHAHLSLAQAYQKAGRSNDALKAAEMALKRDPSDLRIRNLLGLLYFNEGRFEDALKQGLAILEQQPKNIPGHSSVAMLYERLGKPDQAIEHLEEVAKLAQDPARTLALKRIEVLKERNRRGPRP